MAYVCVFMKQNYKYSSFYNTLLELNILMFCIVNAGKDVSLNPNVYVVPSDGTYIPSDGTYVLSFGIYIPAYGMEKISKEMTTADSGH